QDFNLDGRPDVAASHARVGRGPLLTMLPGLGDGTFGEPITTATTGFVLSIASADWNGDGLPDVALASYDPGKILVFYGRGDGTFDSPTTLAPLTTGWGIAAADLNGDGNMDLAATDPGEFRVAALFGDGSGGFTGPTLLAGLGATGSFALGDVNSDGRPDFLASDNGVAAALNRFAPGTPPAEARAFVLGGHRTVPAVAGAGNLCVQVEPANRSYTNDQVDLGSFTLRSEGTGSVSEVHCVAPKRNVIADTDANGVSEIPAFFARTDLAALFDKLRGRTTVAAQLTGSLTDARVFCTGVQLNVVGTGGPPRTASFSPNPLNPQSKLTFATGREGPAKALLFDIQGRLVRTLLDTPRLAAGPHEYSFDGRNDRGRTLSSGVYFYRVQSIEGVFDGQIVILK
ncbi:MAG TPA: T9SS type A sorting domain-containing protein, partial [Candidatus Eisenbacteria bacterium]|nr:T9SS type A sorting domain-containing protein [Candidatus Eisenbacteria bacterium]